MRIEAGFLRVMGTQWNTPKYQIMDEFDISAKSSFYCVPMDFELIEEKRDGDVFEKIPFAKGMAVFHGADYQAERKRNQHG